MEYLFESPQTEREIFEEECRREQNLESEEKQAIQLLGDLFGSNVSKAFYNGPTPVLEMQILRKMNKAEPRKMQDLLRNLLILHLKEIEALKDVTQAWAMMICFHWNPEVSQIELSWNNQQYIFPFSRASGNATLSL